MCMAIALKRLRMGGKEYFIDERLSQIRNVDNPSDYEDVSPELIDFWISRCKMEDREGISVMVYDMDAWRKERLKEEISPELMEKLSDITKTNIRQFYDHHKKADEKLERCDAEGITEFLTAQRGRVDTIHSLAEDSIDKRINVDERQTILSRMDDFEVAKRTELLKSLEKCDCKFK